MSLRPGLGRAWVKIVNSLSAYPTKWPNTLKQFVGNLPTNCFSVFEDFLGLAPNRLTHLRPNFHSYENQSADLQCKLIELFLWVENCFKWSTYHKKQKSNPTFFHINLAYLKSIFEILRVSWMICYWIRPLSLFKNALCWKWNIFI